MNAYEMHSDRVVYVSTTLQKAGWHRLLNGWLRRFRAEQLEVPGRAGD